MTIPETLLTFVGAPAAIYGVIALAVLGPGAMRGPARYRPGRPWLHDPAWFLPRPAGHDGTTSPPDSHAAPAITPADHASVAPVGGAKGEW
jgi:hypothetical protein